MIHQLFYAINLFTQLLVGVFIFHQIGTPKRSFLLILTVWFSLFLGVHEVFLLLGTSGAGEILQMLLKMLTMLVPMLLYRNSWGKRILMMVMFLAVTTLNEPAAILMVCLIFSVPVNEFYSQNDTSIMNFAGKLLIVDLMLLTAVCICALYKRRDRQNVINLKDLGLIAVFISAHLFFLTAYFSLNQDRLTLPDLLIQLAFQALLFVMIFIQYFNSQRTRQLMKSEEELRILQSRMETDYNYYQLASSKFTEISALRHDIQNQMQTVRTLLHSENGTEQAENIIEQLQTHLDEVRAVNYCGNRTINAVLMVKLGEDRIQGIRTEIELHDCEALPFEDYDLCSLASNMFDNAVNACLECDAQQERFVELKSGIRDGYFILRCVNSCHEQAETKRSPEREGHGYGMTIIEQVCRKYDGSYSLRFMEKTAVATAALRIYG